MENKIEQARKWSDDEKRLLLKYFNEGKFAKEISILLNRPLQAVYAKKQRLGRAKRIERNWRYTDEKFLTELKEKYNNGVKYKEMCNEFGIGMDMLRGLIREVIPGTFKRKRIDFDKLCKYDKKFIEKLKYLYFKLDLPQRKVAKRMGVPYHVIRDLCINRKIIKNNKWTEEQINKLKELLNQGKTVAEISIELNRTKTAILHECYNLNIDNKYKTITDTRRELTRPTTIEQLLKSRIKGGKRTSKKRNFEFELTVDFLKKLYYKQNKRCYYTNNILTIIVNDKNALSIDRIDSSKGYLKNNVVLCCHYVNTMKQETEINKFIETCGKIHLNRDQVKENNIEYHI